MVTYNDSLSAYINNVFAVQDQALEHVQENTPRQGLPTFGVTPEEGRFLQFLASACGASRALEFGTLGGYSGIWIARGLAEGGQLISVERNAHHAQVARDHFALAGLGDRVEVRVGDARLMLADLSNEGPFGFVFIDADKLNYPLFFDWAIENTRRGAIIAAHNAFRYGQIVSAEGGDEITRTLHTLNQKVARDPRLVGTIYPGGDGTLAATSITTPITGESSEA